MSRESPGSTGDAWPASATAPLPRPAVAGFAFGALGTGVYSTVPTVLLLFYCTEILRLSPSLAATIVFVPKVWAILWDPLVGVWSDGSRSRFGRRAPFMLAGTIGVAITFAMLFNAPPGAGAVTVAHVAIVYFLMATAYSVYAVPYIAIPAEISPLAAERERLMSWRMAFGLLGVLIGAGLAPHLVALGGGGPAGYGFMAIAISITCGLAMFIAFATVRRFHSRDSSQPPAGPGLGSQLRSVLANGDYVRLLASYLLAMSGATLLIALVPYYITHVIGRLESDAGTAMLVLLGGTVACVPLWAKTIRRWGGWRALPTAVAGYALVAAAFALASMSESFLTVLVLFLALGLPFAGLQLVPFTLLAHIAHDSAKTGTRQEGLYTGVWTAGEKLALAIGPAAAGLGLAMTGYSSGEADPHAAASIQSVMAFGPAVFLLPAALLLITRRDN